MRCKGSRIFQGSEHACRNVIHGASEMQHSALGETSDNASCWIHVADLEELSGREGLVVARRHACSCPKVDCPIDRLA